VALWVKTRTSGGAFLYQGAGSWAGGNTSFFLTSATQATSGAFSGGHVGGVRWGGGWMGGNLNVNDGNWHFIAITDNGGNKTIYVDGNTDTNYDSAKSGISRPPAINCGLADRRTPEMATRPLTA